MRRCSCHSPADPHVVAFDRHGVIERAWREHGTTFTTADLNGRIDHVNDALKELELDPREDEGTTKLRVTKATPAGPGDAFDAYTFHVVVEQPGRLQGRTKSAPRAPSRRFVRALGALAGTTSPERLSRLERAGMPPQVARHLLSRESTSS